MLTNYSSGLNAGKKKEQETMPALVYFINPAHMFENLLYNLSR